MSKTYRIEVRRIVIVEQVTEVLLDLPDWMGEDARHLAAEDYVKHCAERGFNWRNSQILPDNHVVSDIGTQSITAVEPAKAEPLSDIADELQEQLAARHMAQRYAPSKTRPLVMGEGYPNGDTDTRWDATSSNPRAGLSRVTSTAR